MQINVVDSNRSALAQVEIDPAQTNQQIAQQLSAALGTTIPSAQVQTFRALLSGGDSFSLQLTEGVLRPCTPSVLDALAPPEVSTGPTPEQPVPAPNLGAQDQLALGEALDVLGPEPNLPTTNQEARQWCKEAQSELGLPKKEAKALQLDSHAKKAVANLEKLEARGAASALIEPLEQELRSIAADLREAALAKDGNAGKLGALRLNVLLAQTEVHLNAKESNRAALTEAMHALAQAVLDTFFAARPELASDDAKVDALSQHLVSAYQNGTSGTPEQALMMLGRHDGDTVLGRATQQASHDLAVYHQDAMKQVGPSEAERDAPRTPSEVVVHLLSAINQQQNNPPVPELTQLSQEIQQALLKHELTVEQTRTLITNAQQTCTQQGWDELSTLCDALLEQLPATNSDMPLTRLHDNIYGRVFDSTFVEELVKDPPPGVLTAMAQAKRHTHDWIMGANIREDSLEAAVASLQDYLSTKDPRFWFTQTPELMAVRDAPSPQEAVTALKAYLSSDLTTGVDAVAVPYVMVKLWNALAQNAKVDWKTEGDKNYWTVITKQVGRTDAPSSEHGKVMPHKQTSSGGGITLHHQPNPTDGTGMSNSIRPSTVNMPQITPDDNVTASVDTALSHGLPYASGVSGSTNIMLHLLKAMQDEGSDVDVPNFVLGTMMFLVYDGGHSVHEVLWTANQLNETLGFNLDLGGGDDPTAFVADYTKLQALFGDTNRAKLDEALDGAMTRTLDYFQEHSHFAQG